MFPSSFPTVTASAFTATALILRDGSDTVASKSFVAVYAGPLIEYILYDRITGHEPPRERAPKRRNSNDAEKLKNLCNSTKKLEFYLAANFPTPRSALVLTLSFNEKYYRKIMKHRRPSRQRKAVRYYINRFREFMRKDRAAAGLPAPRDISSIEVLTSGNNRWHVHTVIDATGDDLDMIRRCWRFGDNIEAAPLRVDREKNHESLARYMTKEARELQDHDSRPGTHVWSASRNILKPEVVSRIVPADYTPPIPEGAEILNNDRHDNPFSSYRHMKIRCSAEAFPAPPKARRSKP